MYDDKEENTVYDDKFHQISYQKFYRFHCTSVEFLQTLMNCLHLSSTEVRQNLLCGGLLLWGAWYECSTSAMVNPAVWRSMIWRGVDVWNDAGMKSITLVYYTLPLYITHG